MDDLEQLEYLSLVSKVASEIQNHLSISDKTLAEFVIAQHAPNTSLKDFEATLSSMGADFPRSLLESIDRLILTLHPKYKSQKAGATQNRDENIDSKSRVFKGLSIPDKAPQFDTPEEPFDDTFALLEGMAASKPATSKPSSKRRRLSRSRSPRGRNDDFVFEDEYGRTVSRPRHEEKRSRRKVRDDDVHRQPSPEIDDEAVLYKVYPGKVSSVKPYGCFVTLQGIRGGKVDGLVHVSQMAQGRVNDPSDLVARGQDVFVKVIKVENNKISLSMKEADQVSGQDLSPQQRIDHASGANSSGLGNRGDGQIPVIESGFSARPNGRQQRITNENEKWEIQQLINSGVLPRSSGMLSGIDADYHAAINGEAAFEEEEEVDIEVRDEEPPFLAGQTAQSLELSPIRVVKAPDGSLNRAAMSGDTLARERRELRQQEAQEKAAKEAASVDLSSQWNDPMAQQKQFSSQLRSSRPTQATQTDMPEWKKISTGRDASFGKRSDMSIKDQRSSLPIFAFRKQLLEAVSKHQILIVISDTGSGKTTQMTQYLAEAGYANSDENGNIRMIGCTQPRRVAAMSVAKRVAEEVGGRLGEEVGYTIRFENCTSPQTRIKYMTDGILLRELLLDKDASQYSVIMLDEAHERTIATDVLFSLLKKTLKKRPDLKLIVTSATLDADKFSEYFDQCPIFKIPGRTFPVETLFSREPEADYLEAALLTVMQIHLTEPPGDCLVFLTGKEEIDSSCEILSERMKALGPNVPELLILPIYGALPSEVATRIFEPAPNGARKVVIATNIAETSLTIDGIFYVIDPGFVKQSSYDSKLGMDRLQITPISQAQANQRKGRAGRTGPGKCFRLYTEAAFQNEMLPTSIPEIQRQHLSNTVLMLKAMGINDLLHFDFMDPPPTNTMLTALEELYCLGALDDEGLLTRLGRQMADFPMDPSLSKALIYSVELQCSDEVLTIVSMISGATNIFHRPRDKQEQADKRRQKFNDPSGDHITLLNVYNGWIKAGSQKSWAIDNFIVPKNLERVKSVRDQLAETMKRHRLRLVSCGRDTIAVRRSLCSGFFRNSARKDPSSEGSGGYKTLVEGTPVFLHPSSALFGKPAEHIIYQSLVETSKEYMHQVSQIEPKWLVEAAPTFFKVAPTDRLSKRKKAERIQPLHNKFAGEDDWRLSAQKRQGRGGGGTWG
ncbi:pre-mRNA-splicing factor ATP-dependent RNA helicase prp16 [Pleomassaria siparia CBS 279.74]|uniref:RNA helicase n=1 Tax=Pleomassaria siparia CBS 279.74 TaxID=1314801 RepID=A0A6G1K7K5_9PLEO|nr:pre-mRNA-splicing factor ATP-dependent RNA helicase prp16 [Pleomassaria siparia CBS 279.74]